MISGKSGEKMMLRIGDFGLYRKRDKTIAFSRGYDDRPSENLLFSNSDDKFFLPLRTDVEILCLFDIISDTAGIGYSIVKDDKDNLMVVFT